MGNENSGEAKTQAPPIAEPLEDDLARVEMEKQKRREAKLKAKENSKANAMAETSTASAQKAAEKDALAKKKAQSKAQAAAEREQLGLVHVEADETDELTKLRNKARRSAATAKETSIDSLTTIDRQLEQTRNDNKKLYSIQVNTCRCEYMLLPGIIPVTHRSDSTCSPR